MKGHESLAEPGFRLIAQTHPGAVIQCPIDFLAPLAAAAHEDAERMLERLRSWGINRFSIAWRTTNRHMLFDSVERWGFEINLYDVPDIEAFLRAVSPSCCPIIDGGLQLSGLALLRLRLRRGAGLSPLRTASRRHSPAGSGLRNRVRLISWNGCAR